ncbi:MAG TPA: hypothetical protein VFW06_03985 [Acidimicrobiia bacterium]|nr:hypothetical protein [Acidimicrobiia bacterium]
MLSAVAAVAAVAALGAACSTEPRPEASRAFCRAADRYNTELERAQEKGRADVERQLPLVEALAEAAPEEIRADAETFADALRRVETEPGIRDDPDVKTAVENVNRFANQACNVYERDSGI